MLVVGTVGGRLAHSAPRIPVSVAGQVVRVSGTTPTVADALRAADVIPPGGALRSAGTGSVVEANHTPPTLYVDGHLATPATPVLAGTAVTFEAGPDVVEATQVRRVPTGDRGLPHEEKVLWRPGAPGEDEIVVGVRSGEEVGRRTITAAAPATPVTDKVVSLSFDDGPHPTMTPEVLRVLREHQVKAVFCVVGSLVRRHPDLVKGIVGEGHTLCNHSQTHLMRMDLAPPGIVRAEVLGGAVAIHDVTGHHALFYRPPGGSLSTTVIHQANERGQRVLTWSIDSLDYRPQTPQQMTDRIVSQLHPGGMILMHDGGGDHSATLAQLPALITRIKEAGYQIVLPPV